ncbi:protocatechuate 3,4-dioxygenase subunit alpha [Roseivivax isoporae]|uniref:Protocatechuate 3,4-dioxygenase subunit alpha n=1 Tax=Roseivivax isoporae LMG 25204 TaxID=1449351 RepID=X7FDJ7_9RHOB|nr:protocatechuate 3,4-dioxygenase subunit alpha [Roseivivax isoporae]ETX30885.1 protocatechuate 3,4-dioxygenase subunit alpha [Roseivivax isoporae LMG 25204]
MHRDPMLKESPSQTAGPYVHIGCLPNLCGIDGVYPEDLGARMYADGVRGQKITVRGRILDGTGSVVRDALVEVWQADAEGRMPGGDPRGPADPAFAGFVRRAADPETGDWTFDTVKPGRVPWPDGRLQAPHATLWIVARGINLGLHTRMYFADEDAANDTDPVLARIEHRGRVATLLAQPEGPDAYRFDIRLQGPDETVFFDV